MPPSVPPSSLASSTSTLPPASGMPPPVKRLVVLQSASQGCEYQDDDSPADVVQHIARAGYDDHVLVENIVLTPENYARQLVQLARRFEQGQVDCCINLCDGAWDEPSCGIQVVDLLENKLDLPFTGADVAFFEPTRLQMKQACLSVGVKVPHWRFVYNETDLDVLLAEFSSHNGDTINGNGGSNALKFPLLVKHFSSYSSVGLTKESKVFDLESLHQQCQRMLTTYGGALVEEFIVGREFTVLAAQTPAEHSSDGIDVVAFEPVECKFAQGEDFKHYHLKWVDYEDISWHPVQDQDLARRLKELAVSSFQASGGRGYGRVDVRSDATGQNLYFLEVNPNCGLFYPQGLYGSADFILDQKDPLKAHADFCLDQVEVARRLWYQRRAAKSMFEARYDVGKESWGLYALQDIAQGQVIQRHEEASLRVVSKSHVWKHWQGAPDYNVAERKTTGSTIASADDYHNTWDNFRSYCWPLSDNLFAMWQPRPDQWQPINHSCDPNAWNESGNGLNVVARRDIRAGEEICMDYACFCGYFAEMKEFACQCNTPSCRGTITGMDIVKYPNLCRRYRGHMSDYVAQKAREIHGAEIFDEGPVLVQ